ncbi:uncharacterized protein LOC124286646 [Haliotis rubra]|uniref:uncharacterized protein LOC124286646 n=1 Tax=Haliotis rubra TaxID=36100 RepID=UPI001EE59D1E|nr:uncharacterized protein LOC124286646 [Haliotis rubra]
MEDCSLYPYGEGDVTLNTDNVPVNLGNSYNYFGRKFDTVYISKDGVVGLNPDVKYEEVRFQDGSRDPDHDLSFLAPFHFNGNNITSDSEGKIYYRLYYSNTTEDQDFLTELRYYMLNATVGNLPFEPAVALVVTWENVTAASQPCECQRATFQMVLVACSLNTFIIFNYNDISLTIEQFYQAGINGGHGVGWTSVCTGCNLIDLPSTRGSDVTGRFIFRVSKDQLERSGCTIDGSTLQILPKYAGMFGGELLDISGPCLDDINVSVMCRFGSGESSVTSEGFRFNSMRLKCPVPRLTGRGPVPVAVSVDGGSTFTGDGTIYRATFQMVLVASSLNTFIIFNYNDISLTIEQFYQAGINGGHGVGWTSVCTGCNLIDLPSTRGSDVTGRFIFRVSKDQLERSGCTIDGSTLQILPKYAGMFGGELLDISGPCLDDINVSVMCRFGSGESSVTSEGFRFNSMRLKCPVPRLTGRGPVPVAVSVDGGSTFTGDGTIYVVLPLRLPNASLELGKGWYDVTPSELNMTWDPLEMTSDPDAKVDITLVGYRETKTELIWKTLRVIASSENNTGNYSFRTAEHQCQPADCQLFEVAIIEVQLQKPYHALATSRVVMSPDDAVTIGWFVKNAMTTQYGSNWSPQLCTQWSNRDMVESSWMNQLLYCPCNLGQALADFGRWQADLGCNIWSFSSSNCFYHKGAVHCVRSFLPTSTGAGNQCCYGSDGVLKYAADTYQGSTPDRSHDWGAAPYNKPDFVPYFSHWIHDVVTFYYCCLWTDNSNCDDYMARRPTRDCNGYRPPQAAMAYGDPHIMTFDGKLYNFGGKGDYYLVKSTQFSLQGKFDIGEQNHADGNSVNATVLTSVAMLGVSGPRVEIRLAPPGSTVAGVSMSLWMESGVSVINVATDPDNNLHDNFTVIMQSGVGVQVAASNRLLHVIVNMPPSFKNMTSGLMGTWNGDMYDDFTAKNGDMINATSSAENIYQAFGTTWDVPERESLFSYHDMADIQFVPVFAAPQGSNIAEQDLNSTCGANAQCRFDYTVTSNVDIANASKIASGWFTELKSFQQTSETCGLLNVPYSLKDNYNYNLNSTVTITGCRNMGLLRGETTYTCTRSDTGGLAWSPDVTAECSTGSLYPFGRKTGDMTLQTDTNLPIYLGYDINVFGRKYDTVYVNKDGIVGFDSTVRYEETYFNDTTRDPSMDLPFAAPFHFSGRSIIEDEGKVYYRLAFSNTSEAFLKELQTYMLDATIGWEPFEPVVALVVTWYDVVDGAQQGCKATNTCKTAMFQMVLVACEMHTLVVFNYLSMDIPVQQFYQVINISNTHLWIHIPVFSYLTMDIPVQQFYQAGINQGHGLGWTSVCTGCSFADLPNTRGSDVIGRFIYRISKDTLEIGGCLRDRDLQIRPKVAGMFGGELLDISGPCLNQSVNVMCRFGSGETSVTSEGFRFNSMRLRCPVPRLAGTGFVPVSVSIDGGNNYTGSADIYIVVLGKLELVAPGGSNPWREVNPPSLTMRWDPVALSKEEGVLVEIRVVGYREDGDQINWKTLSILSSEAANSGEFTFTPSDHQCQPEDCAVYEIGFVEVELKRDFRTRANTKLAVKSGVTPLGWFVNSAMSRLHGSNWAPQLCTSWYNKDKVNMTWMDKLLYCPCTLSQGLSDFGRWQSQSGCNIFSTSPDNCFYHKEAVHCVRSLQPSSTGAGNQCCYGKDGLLIYAADTYQGSTPDRSHDWGAAPYNKPGRVPSLSHWIKDVVTFYYCCLWTEYSHCNYYMDQRATRDCNGYRPPKAAFAYGDPHMMTFDGKLYNFGGKGDYYLVKSDQFSLQGKFDIGEQNHADGSRLNATVLTSVAMLGVSGPRVEIRLAPPGLNSGRRLDVFVDGQMKLFDASAMFKQTFSGGVSVINVAIDPDNNLHDNFTVIMQSGVGVQVAAVNRLLHVIVNMPPALKNTTSGLMGTWNDMVADDFTPKSGGVVEIGAPKADVYQLFGKTWNVLSSESLFKHQNAADMNFIPIYDASQLPQGTGVTEVELATVCGMDAQCRFDYVVTGSSVVAAASRQAAGWFTDIKSFQQPAQSCGLLNVPFATKSSRNYTYGNTVTVTGCRNKGTVKGETTYQCSMSTNNELRWTPDVTAECVVMDDKKAEYTGPDNVAATVGIIVTGSLVSIIIIVVVVVRERRKYRRQGLLKKKRTMS